MENLTITERPIKDNDICIKKWTVKEGSEKFGEIQQMEKGFSVTINGTTTQQNTLTDCIDLLNETAGHLFFNKVIFKSLS